MPFIFSSNVFFNRLRCSSSPFAAHFSSSPPSLCVRVSLLMQLLRARSHSARINKAVY